jgi:integrase
MAPIEKNPETLKPGRHGFGRGLWLHVATTGGRSWSYRYSFNEHAHCMGLGGFPRVSLEQARAKAAAARKLARQGIDPIEWRKDEDAKRGHETFGAIAESLIVDLQHKWRSPKSAREWRASLEKYAFPHIGAKHVADIDKHDVLRCLRPIWATRPTTADRLRWRIEAVLNRAHALGLRGEDNPASWKTLEHLLPRRASKSELTRHLAAMPYEQLPTFMRELREVDGTAARALEFCVLTAARSEEVLGAKWDEIDLAARLWRVPAARMKGGRAHAAPLSFAAVRLLSALPRRGEFLFADANGRRLSADAMRQVLRHLKRDDVTVHGFKASFRTWASEETAHSHEACEEALAHRIGKTELAYRRRELLRKRRELMDDWSDYCTDGDHAPSHAQAAE